MTPNEDASRPKTEAEKAQEALELQEKAVAQLAAILKAEAETSINAKEEEPLVFDSWSEAI